jgi:DNA-binding GntR family transcriptional regulator
MAINPKSLREQVYDFLREELTRGKLIPGASVDLNAISQELGISKTPLRDALLQLDTEGFVTISPRRGVYVNRLTLEDIRNCYEIVGALETTALLAAFDRIQPIHIEKLKLVNASLRAALKKDDWQAYYQDNLVFHEIFLGLSYNTALKRIIVPMKQRLYDFPRRGYIKEWEQANCRDHDRLIEAFERLDREAAVRVWRDGHWSFQVQEPFIRRFYFPETLEGREAKRRHLPPPKPGAPARSKKTGHRAASLRKG